MWYRLPRREYETGKGRLNKQRFKRVVARGAPGLLAYRGPSAVGWCAVAPREEYRRLETTRTMKMDDGVPVWTIMCLYVDPGERQRGLSVALIRRTAQYALDRGAPAVEAYPVVPRKGTVPPVFASQGILSSYVRAGFRVVKTVSASRAVVRYEGRP